MKKPVGFPGKGFSRASAILASLFPIAVFNNGHIHGAIERGVAGAAAALLGGLIALLAALFWTALARPTPTAAVRRLRWYWLGLLTVLPTVLLVRLGYDYEWMLWPFIICLPTLWLYWFRLKREVPLQEASITNAEALPESVIVQE